MLDLVLSPLHELLHFILTVPHDVTFFPMSCVWDLRSQKISNLGKVIQLSKGRVRIQGQVCQLQSMWTAASCCRISSTYCVPVPGRGPKNERQMRASPGAHSPVQETDNSMGTACSLSEWGYSALRGNIISLCLLFFFCCGQNNVPPLPKMSAS